MNIGYKNLVIRLLNNENIDEILSLQEKVVNELTNKDLLRVNTREMFEHCMCLPNITLGVYFEDRLIAVGIFYDGTGTDEDLGKSLKHHKVTGKTANVKLVFVDSELRGLKLQRILMFIMEEYAADNKYEFLCTTVSPDNEYSINSVIKSGYDYDNTLLKYGGLVRNLYVKSTKDTRKTFEDYDLITEDVLRLNKKPRLENVEISIKNESDYLFTGDILEYRDGERELHGIYVNESENVIFVDDTDNISAIESYKSANEKYSLYSKYFNVSKVFLDF